MEFNLSNNQDRETAYVMLNLFQPYAAGYWFGEKHQVMAREAMTLAEMEGDHALAVVQGLAWQKVFGMKGSRFADHYPYISYREVLNATYGSLEQS